MKKEDEISITPSSFTPYVNWKNGLKDVKPDEKIYPIIDGVFLGTCYGAEDLPLLQSLGIQVVMNCTWSPDSARSKSSVAVENFHGSALRYVNYDLRDHIGEQIRPSLLASSLVIDKCVEDKQKIFVHCSAGLSRSASVVIAWLMKSRGMNLYKAVKLVYKQRKRLVACNASFWSALAELEGSLGLALQQKPLIPTFDFVPWVVDDFKTMGFSEIVVRRVLKEKNYDSDATLSALLDGTAAPTAQEERVMIDLASQAEAGATSSASAKS